jgi:hypothetical protein
MNRHSRMLFKKAMIRLFVLTVISTVVVLGVMEVSFIFQKDPGDRGPQVIELIIPQGTAQMVAAGEQAASIPEEMSFVVGDTLVIHNQDDVQHQLGPLYIPAKSSASLGIKISDSHTYTCSFQQTKFLGLDVHPATTIWTRMQGLLLAAPSTAIFLFVYSLNIFPLEKKPKTKQDQVDVQAVSSGEQGE